MSIPPAESLSSHKHHSITIAIYGNSKDPVNVAVECEECGLILDAQENPDRLQDTYDELNDGSGTAEKQLWNDTERFARFKKHHGHTLDFINDTEGTEVECLECQESVLRTNTQ